LPQASGEGCGLGLAIVDEIARAHQALMEVSPGRDGQGSRFTLSFRAGAEAPRTGAGLRRRAPS
jgi:two-component system sensor histidine kinase TctE